MPSGPPRSVPPLPRQTSYVAPRALERVPLGSSGCGVERILGTRLTRVIHLGGVVHFGKNSATPPSTGFWTLGALGRALGRQAGRKGWGPRDGEKLGLDWAHWKPLERYDSHTLWIGLASLAFKKHGSSFYAAIPGGDAVGTGWATWSAGADDDRPRGG